MQLQKDLEIVSFDSVFGEISEVVEMAKKCEYISKLP